MDFLLYLVQVIVVLVVHSSLRGCIHFAVISFNERFLALTNQHGKHRKTKLTLIQLRPFLYTFINCLLSTIVAAYISDVAFFIMLKRI